MFKLNLVTLPVNRKMLLLQLGLLTFLACSSLLVNSFMLARNDPRTTRTAATSIQCGKTLVRSSRPMHLKASQFLSAGISPNLFELHSTADDDSELFESIITNELKSSQEEEEFLSEIAWRTKKVELEEANTRRFQKRLKSKPWKLPYADASIWVQRNLGVDTKEEFFDFVANGNVRTPYIPKEPEKYYSDNGTWISWDHFLKG